MIILLKILTIFVIVTIAGLFSLLEIAIVAVSEYRLQNLSLKHKWAQKAYLFRQDTEKILIFSQFGNSFFNALVTMLATVILVEIFGGKHNAWILSIATLFISLSIIIFSESAPKIIAARAPEAVLKLIIYPLSYFYFISYPIIWLIAQIVHFITSLVKSDSMAPTLEEIKAMVLDQELQVKETQREILLNSIELESLLIKEVLIPLRFVETINIADDIADIITQLEYTHHSKIIVYRDQLENIIGYFHIKDLFANFDNIVNDKQQLELLLRKINTVYDFMTVIKQLQVAQKVKEKVFVVINEFEDIIGICCISDMLEIVFGEFSLDAPHRRYFISNQDNNSLIIDGFALLRELNERYNFKLSLKKDALTLNGYILKKFNGLPSVGVCFREQELIFEVISMGQYWVERVKITKYNMVAA